MRVPRFRDLSLRVKLTLVSTLIAGMALAIDCAAILASTWFGSRATSAHDLATRADIVGSNCTAAITFDDRTSAADTLKGLAADEYMLAACVYGRDGRPFAHYRPPGATVVIPPQAGEPQHRFDGGRLTVLRPITLDGETIGSIWLAWDWGLYHSQFLDLTGIVFGVMVVSLGIALFLATRLQRVFTAPVLDLVETARRVTLSRHYTERARKHAQDELGALTDAFNEMLTQIQNRDVALRRAYDELEERVRQRTLQLNEAKERAESADRAKSEFLANMSHEIRTPMTAILGFSEMLTEPNLPEPQRLNAVHTIRRNGEHLLSVLNDVLDLSKIEAGRMTIERIPCSPAGVVAEVLSLMRVRADAKKLSLDCEYEGAVPETIQSDPTRLRQILLNLIGNAIKFTKVGGVRLIVRLVTGEAPMLQFDVQDTGIGMSVEEMDTLFCPFTQVDTSHTRRFGGTGLGLVISRRLAELLGGTVGVVDSRPGAGTTLRLRVATGPLDGVRSIEAPSSQVPSTADQRAGRSALPGALNCRILLAEDAPDNQRLVSHILGKAGAAVTIVENGKLAVDRALSAEAEGSPFDVILMDMQMPVMDGYEAAGLLRQKGYRGAIVALTAHAMMSDREKCLCAGCDDFTAKPVDRTKLIEVVRRHVGRVSRAVLTLLLAGVVLGRSEPVPAADKPPLLGPTNREEIALLVRALGDPAYEARMFATRRLCAIGMEAWDVLREGADGADVEASLRAKQLLAVFDRLWFSGAEVSLSFSKPLIDWLEPVDLNITMTNRLPYPARVPFDLHPTPLFPPLARGEAAPLFPPLLRGEAGGSDADDARQVADMLDLAEWLKVRAPDGRELELRVDDIGGEPAVFAVVQSRLAGGPGGALTPGEQITVTARAFNRGWARFPLLDRGEYTVMLDYVPDWTDEVLAAARAGRVVSTPATVTIRDGAPPTVSRSGIQADLIVEREADFLIARLVNRTDQPLRINTNFGGSAPFADGRWVYELDQVRRDLPLLPKTGASWHDFNPALLVEVGAGESAELARIAVKDLRKTLTDVGVDLSGNRWGINFTYANLCDRQWQTRQGSALLGNENAPPLFQQPLPRRILSARHGSNRLPASSLD